MFNKFDVKSYLLLSSNSILNILKLSSRIVILPSVVIYPSSFCNYNCLMCWHAKDKKTPKVSMDFSIMEKAIKDCAGFVFKPYVHFSGLGEPLVYPKIKKVMELCKENKLKWSMTTNGYLLDRHAEDLISNNCHAINVSVHGSDIEHNKISGVGGSFRKVVENIKELNRIRKKLGRKTPLVAINCVFNNENIPNLKKILNTFTKLPVNSVTFQHLIFTEQDMKKKEPFIIKENKLKELVEFVDWVRNTKLPLKVNFFPSIKTEDLTGYYSNIDHEFNDTCVLPWLTARVYPNGDVRLCNYHFGNIKKDSLKSIVKNKQARKFRDSVRKKAFKIPDCFRCCHRHYY